MMTVTSSSFKNGERIPRKHTGEGEDVSPEIGWSGAPPQTQEFALICDDPDAPRPTPWVHWVVYNIPRDQTTLPEGVKHGITEGKNDFGRTGYNGCMPPKGHGVHHYHFKVYALDTELGLGPGITKDGLLQSMEGRILDQGELVGTYERS